MPAVLTQPKAEAAEKPVETADTDTLITQAAEKYGVNRQRLYDTLYCESAGFTDPAIQSRIIRADGTREPSYGYGQFFLPSSLKTADGRTITYEIAINPREAIDSVAYNFSIGNASHWSCWRKLYLQ